MSYIQVSVVIPTYNRASYLDRCLKSLEGQTYKNFEVLVCDDGSTDNTADIVRKYDSSLTICYIKDENFGGPARPRNNGIRQATGEFIAFLDSDDWWYPTKLEVAVRWLEHFDLVYHRLDKYSNDRKETRKTVDRVLVGDIVKDLIVNGNAIANSSVVIRKSIVTKVGALTEDRNFIAVEDFDYWIRVAQHTDRFKCVDQSLGGYWVGENISNSLKQIERHRCVLEKYRGILSEKEQNKMFCRHYYFEARTYHSHLFFTEARSSYTKSFDKMHVRFLLKAIVAYIFCILRIKY